MLGLDRESSIWMGIYFVVSWTTQFGHGMITTVVGPTQPYLAKNTGVAIDTVNFVWTFGFFGFLVGSLLTGFVYKKYITSARGKLTFLFINICLSGIFVIVLPFTTDFGMLVTARLIQHFTLGAFITADASLIVYLLGPEKSPPFTMLLHAVIGAGFLVSTLMVQPFLPSEGTIDKDTICNSTEVTTNEDESAVLLSSDGEVTVDEADTAWSTGSVPMIAWPFIISGSWCILCSFGFLILACLPYSMPRFYTEEQEHREAKVSKKRSKQNILFFTLVFFYYFISCGIERIYQPMASTFGLCGPLDLSPSKAVATDSFYNGGFMCGRLASAVVAGFILPRTMIVVSLTNCVLAAILLCAVAGTSMYGLYIGTAWIGFFVSWQFGAAFSWVATKVNITGNLSSLFFVGCGFGSLATPPLSGYIFTSSLGPMSIMYLTLIFCVLQCTLFLSMYLLSRSLFPTIAKTEDECNTDCLLEETKSS